MRAVYFVLPSLLLSSTLVALPESAEVAAGFAEFQAQDENSLHIRTSDKAIINYRKFNIKEGERVQFIQPNAKSAVLNRIRGGDPSKILGMLSGNGRVFLVNPSGIYFGPNAIVNTGSFVASTLNIRDEDFMNDKLHFFMEQGSEKSLIVNEGAISSGQEGFIAFFAPFIENRGSVLARAGKVVMASAERVTLDFTGDGLVQFTIDGELKNALIENFGKIEAANGAVELSMRTARDAIKMVVNTDGITPANAMEEINGVIRLISQSSVAADQIHIDAGDAGKVETHGSLDASITAFGKSGGEVQVLGHHIELHGAQIDASGDAGGGVVLIGGDYQGKGEVHTAQFTWMDDASQIKADAYRLGDGGKIIVWSDDTTLFDGKISARGGVEAGDGGFVETSGKMNLGVQTGFVDTSAPLGRFGDWLLDPNSITIATGGGGTIAQASSPNCATGGGVNISVATMQAAATNVALCAQQNTNSTITVNNAFTMAAGVSLSMTAGSANAGTITLGANIATRGQPITLTGVTVISANVLVDTTNAGGSPAGANISFSNTINGSGARTLTLTGGTSGVVTLSGAVGGTTALTSLTASGATINQNSTAKTTGALSYTGTSAINIAGNVTTSGGVITMTGPVTASGSPTFDSTNAGGTAAGANISFSSTLNGATAITLRAGTGGTVTFSGAVGGSAAPTNLSFTSANLIQIGNNITVSGANPLTFPSPVSLTGTSVITSNNANISFSSTLNGAQALTITGGSGTTTFTGAVGGTTALSSLSATAATVTQSSTAKTTGALSYTGSTAINIGGSVTTSGGVITMTGPVTASGSPTFDSTNAGGTAAGANISFSSTLNGATAITLRAGTGGTVTFTGAVGNSAAPTNLSFTSANLIQIGNNITVSGANPLTFPSPVSLTGTSVITSNNANVSFSSTLNGAQALTITGGSGTTTFTGAVGGTTPLSSLSVTAATVTQSSTAKTTGALSYTGSTAINVNGNITTSGGIITMTGPVTIGATEAFDTTNAGGTSAGANISFSSTLNGANGLTLNGGTGGTVTFTGAVGGTTALTSLSATGATVTQSSTAKTTGALSYTGSTAINIAGNVTTSGGVITMTGPVTASGSPTFDSTNAGGTAAGANISFSSTLNGATAITLRAGTGGTVTFSGAVGNSAPPTNLSFTSANLIQIGNNITISGANPLTFPSPVSLTGTSTITSNNANVSFNSTLNGAQALTIAGGSGTTTFTGAVGGTTALSSLSATAATVTQSSTAKTTGALSYTGSTAINVNGNITTSGGIITMTGPVTIGATEAFDTTNAGGTPAGANITFSSTINGANGLTLNGGTGGTVSFGAVGGTTPLTSLTASGATVSQNSTAKTTGAVSYTGSSAINLGGNITTSGGTIGLTGPATLTANTVLDTTNSGGTPAGANITTSSNVTGSSNTLTVNGGTGGTVSIGGNLNVSSFTLTNSSSTTVSGTTTAPTVVLSNTAGAITFGGAVTVSTTFTTAAQGYSLIFDNGGTITPATTLLNTGGVTLQSGSSSSLTFGGGLTSTASATTILGTVSTSVAAASMSFGTVTFSSGNSTLSTPGGTVGFANTVTLTGNATVDTTNSGGTPAGAAITFNGAVNGPGNLTLIGGTGGAISLNGTVGGSPAIGVLTITSAGNVTANAITASSIVQSAGSGTTTFNGAVNTSGSAGIVLTGTNFAIDANITTTNGGPLTINHTGSLTIAPGVTLSISGAFNDNGSGSGVTDLAGNITTNGQNIAFANPVVLVGTASLSTGSGVGNILFSSTLNGAQNLTLSTGLGNITFTGAVGGTTPLGTVTINTVNNVNANALSVASYNQLAGAGTSTFNGAVNTSNVAGFSLVGTNAMFNSSVTTTNSGPASIQISNTLTLSSSAAFNLQGAFTQSGTGSVIAAGSITTNNSLIQFAGPVSLSSSLVLNSGSGSGGILFSSAVDGPGALTMTAGTGNITLSAAAGATTRLGALTINSANNVSTQAITAASIDQTVAASGTSTYSGELNTSAAAGITLDSTVLNVSGNLITTNSGPVVLTHAGALALTAGSSTSIASTFTENGTGTVSLTGTITTSNAAIVFTNPVSLTGTTSINSGLGTGSVTFISTIDGGQNLTLASGLGNTSLGGNVGSTTRLNNLTITQAANVSTNAITAATLTQLGGTGTTTFNGAINTNAVGGVNLTGFNFTVNDPITTTSGGPLFIANDGTLNLASGATCSIAGAFTELNIGPVILSDQITTGGAISLAGPITLSGSASLSTAAASQNITIANTVDGSGNLTLAAGGGNISLQSALGSNTRIGALTVVSVNNLSTQGITAASIDQQAGTGTTTITGDLNTNGSAGMTFIVNNFTRTGNLATTNGGPVTVTNSGTLTSISTGTRTIDGFYLQNGTGPVFYAGTIQTNNQPITFSSAVTLEGNVTLNSGTGGGNVSLLGTVNGAYNLALAAGTGNITLSGTIGGTTPLSALTLTSANNVTAQNPITALTISQAAGTGTSIFNGALTASTPTGISLTGTAFQFNSPVTTTGAGAFTLVNSGTALFAANFSIDGVFSQSGSGAVDLDATIATNGDNLTFGSPIILTGTSTISSGGAGTGNVTLSSTVDGAQALTLLSGTGDIIVSGVIGSTTPLSQLTATGANITLANIGTTSIAGITGTTSITGSGNLNFTGSTYNAGVQTYSAQLANVTSTPLTTFSTSGAAISFASAPLLLAANANLAVNSANGNIAMGAIDAGANNADTVSLNAGTGSVTLSTVGTLGNAEVGSLSITSGDILLRGNVFTNAIAFSSSGSHHIFLGADITTVDNPITFPVNVIRDTINNSTLTSSGGTITFEGSVDGDSPLQRILTIAAGSGDAVFVGDIGDNSALISLAIASARNVTTAAVHAGSVTQVAGTGITTFGGQVTLSNAGGVDLTGTNFTFNSGVDTTTGSGQVLIDNSGTLTINSPTTWNLGGNFIQFGSGSNRLAATIDSNSGISFDAPVTLIGNTDLDTSAGNATIDIGSTINGGFNLTLNAGTGNIIVDGAVGSISRIGTFLINSATNITTNSIAAASIDFTWGSGTFSFTGNLNTNAPAGIILTGTNVFTTLGSVTTSNGGPLTVMTSGTTSGTSGGPILVSGSILQSSTGTGLIGGTFISLTGNITTAHNIILNQPLTADTSAGNGNIIIQGTVNGNFPLTFNAGSGNVQLQQNVGSSVPIGAFKIESAGNVTTQAINAASITQLAGTGTTTLNGALSTTGSAGISIANNSVVRGAAITTINGGPCTIAISNTGTFTSTAAGAITCSGAFAQTGSGAVSFGGTLITANNNISFAGPITLAADAVFNSGVGLGDTTFSSTVQGAHNLTIIGGLGSITLNGNVGTSLTPLTSLSIPSALNMTTQAITAGFIQQLTGTGTSTFNGALTTNTSSGIALTGTNFAFNAPLTTTSSGTFTLSNSGLAILSSAATASIAGNFSQTGTGTTQLSDAITSTSGTISFVGPVTLAGTALLTTTNEAISFFNTLDSSIAISGSVTVSCGSANFTLGGSAGSITPLNNLTISNANNVSTQSIAASTITQSAGSGTTTFSGDLNASGSGGIQLIGTNFTFLGDATSAGSININESGTLITTAGESFSAAGGFAQTGGGTVSLASNISASNNNISFASPITLISDVTLNSGTTAGNITLDTVDGNFNLTLTAGQDISAGTIGSTTPLETVTVTTARNISVSSITAGAVRQQAGTGTTALNGAITTNTAAGINLTGNNFIRNGSIVTTNGGSFVVTNSGLISGTSINTTSIDGSYTQTGVGPLAQVELAGSITARQGISFSSPITLLSDPSNLTPIVLDTSGGNGNIVISGTIDNDLNAPHELILRAGSGSVTLSGGIGQSEPIGPIVFGNINNLTSAAISAASLQQQVSTSISGTALFNDAISTSGASGIALTGTTLTFNANVTTSGGGPLTATTTTALNLANGITVSLTGPFSQTGEGAVLIGSTVTTTGNAISFVAPVILTGSTSLSTGSGSGNITFSSLINGASALTLAASGGNISLQGSAGQTTPLTSFTINSANSLTTSAVSVAGPIAWTSSGAMTLSGTVTTTTAGGTIALNNGGTLTISNPIVSSSSLIQSQTGSVSLGANLTSAGTLQLASATTLTNNATLNSGGGSLNLVGTVDSDLTARNLTLTSGSGNITLSSAIGSTHPLSTLLISSAHNVTAAAISAASIQQAAGTGLSQFNSTLTTTGASGVSLTGSGFTLNGVVTTTSGGPLTINHSGTLTLNALPSSGSHSLSGPFSESGGPVSAGVNITLSNQPATFHDAVTLIGNTSVTSNGGEILFVNTVDGPFCLTLNAGTGAIVLEGAIGSTVNLGCLTLTGATIAQESSVTTSGAVQETGALQIGGNISTSASDITLTGNVSLTGSNTTFSAGGGIGGGAITVTGTLNPAVVNANLTTQTGSTGSVTFEGTVGGVTPFNNFTVNSGTISVSNIGTATSGVTGTLALTSVAGLDFTGTTYNAGAQNYTAGTNFNFNSGASTTMNSNGSSIRFSNGTMELSSGTNLSITTGGGNATLTDLFGAGQTLSINASLGTVTVAHIGTVGQPLNAINVSAATLNAPFTTFPPITFTPVTPTIITTNQVNPLTYFSPVIISADNIVFSFSSCPGGNNVIFQSTLDSDGVGNSRNIVFNMCGNTLTFNQAVGSTAPLSSITVNDDTGVTVNSAMAVGAYTQNTTRAGATTTFNSGLTTVTNAAPTPTSGNVNITTDNITLLGSYTIAGTMTLDNSGTLNATGIACTTVGGFSQTGAGGVTLNGNIQAEDSAISFQGPVTLNGALTLNTFSATGADISFANTVGGTGAFNLSLTAGGGDITFSSNVGSSGSRLGTVQFISDRNLTAPSIFASSISQLAGSGTLSFTGAIDTNGSQGIGLTGANISLTGSVNTTNDGSLIVTNSGTFSTGSAITATISGSMTQNGSSTNPISLGGSFSANAGISFVGPLSLTGNTTFDSSGGGGSIALSNTVNGAHTLTLQSGSGNISLASALGGTTPLTAFTLGNLHSITALAISAGSISQSVGTSIGLQAIFNGALSTTGASGIVLAAPTLTFNNNITTTSGGPLTLTNTGTLSFASGITASLSGPFAQSGGGTVQLAGSFTTSNQNISFANAVTLNGTTSLTSGTGAGAGNIAFSSTVDGNQSLTLTAGSGTITFGGSVGSIAEIGALSIVSVDGITYPSMVALSINQMANSGLTTINGPLLTTGSAGISLTGGAFTQNGTVTTVGTGAFAIQHSGLFAIGTGGTTIVAGGYTDSASSTGPISIGTSITSPGSVSFAGSGAITLTADTSLTSDISNGGITINGTVDGAHNLTLSSGTSFILITANIGQTTPLTSLRITSANNVDLQKVSAGTLSQAAGTGTTIFHDTVTISGLSGISLTGTGFTFDQAVTTSFGPITISNAGIALFNSGATVSSNGAFLLNGSGTAELANAIATTSGQIQCLENVTLTGNASLNSAAGNQLLEVQGLINGAHNLTLTTGSGNLTLLGDVGSVTPLSAFTLSSSGTLNVKAISASSITQTGAGNATYGDGLSTTGSSGINLTGTAITLQGNATTAASGPITIANAGLFTSGPGTTLSADGGFLQTGAGAVSLASNITANNNNISFVSPMTLLSDVTLNSGTTAGDITVDTVDGNFNLTFTAGQDITAGVIGGSTPLASVKATTVRNNNASSITAGAITQLAGTGTTTLNGNITTNTPAGINLTGNNFIRSGSIITTNGGSFIVTNSGLVTGTSINTTSIDGFYTQIGVGSLAQVDLAGSITARLGISYSSPITLLSDPSNLTPIVLDSSGGNGNILITGTIDNDLNAAHNLVLNAGSGNVTVTGTIGSSQPINTLKATGNAVSIADVGTSSAAGMVGAIQIPNPSAITTPNQISFTGTIVNAQTQQYTATTSFNMNAGALTTIKTNGNPISFTTGTIQLSASTNLTINSLGNTSGGNITTAGIQAGVGTLHTLVLNAWTGSLTPGTVQPGTIGVVGNSEFASVSLSGTLVLQNSIAANAIIFSPVGTMTIGGNLTTVNNNLTFPNAVTLTGSNNFSTGGGNILFSSTLDGDASMTRNLVLSAGTGNITFAAAVGGTFPPNLLSIASAGNVQATAAGATINTGALLQFSGSGTTEFANAVTTNNSAGLSFTGTNLQLDSTCTLTTLNSGPLFVANSGTLTMSGTAILSGGLNQTGSGSVALSGSISSAQPVSFAGPVSLTGTPSINTSTNGQPISFNNTLNGPGNLTMTAGSGNIALAAAAGATTPLGAVTIVSAHDLETVSVTAISINQMAGSGTTSISGNLTTSGSAGITLVGTNYIRSGNLVTTGGGSVTFTNSGLATIIGGNIATVSGSYIQNGTGPYDFAGSISAGGNISFTSAITLLGSGSFDTSSGGGSITLANTATLNGAQPMTLNAGTGSIFLNAPIGNNVRLGALTITSAANVNAVAITAASIAQNAGTGTTTFSGDLNTNTSSGIVLTGTNFVRGGNWTTTVGGPIEITLASSGTLTSTAVGTINAAGGFEQFGSGSVLLSRTINTTNAPILFSGPISLAGATVLSTGAGGGGGITFGSTVDGAQTLTLTSGTGNISAQGAIGSNTSLSSIAINTANNATFQALNAGFFTQLAGSGTSTLNGPTVTSTSSGINLNSNNVTINGNLTTTNSGPVQITNSGLLDVAGTCSVAANFTQSGIGTNALSGSITSVSGQITFATALSTSGTAQLTTASQPISFSSTIDGPGNLTLNAGAAGDITVLGAIGSSQALGNFTISNVRNLSTQAIAASTLTQTIGSGTTSILGNIATTGSGGINLTGAVFTMNGSITTTNLGPMSVTHSGLLTLIGGPSTLITGSFTESGTGTVSLSGLVHATQAQITFNNPITLLNPTTIDSDGVGDILIVSSVNGATDLTLNAGTFDINVTAPIGNITPINNLTIVSANNATFESINAMSITQSAGSGLTTFTGAVDTNFLTGINLTGTAFTFDAPVTTTGNGPLLVNNSGTVNIAATSGMTLSGRFSQTGPGQVLLAANIATDNDPILFDGPVSLENTITLTTSTAAGGITFANTLDGFQNLNLVADSASITFSQAVGGATPLDALTVTSAANLNSQAISAASISISGINNTATFGGTLKATGAGIALTGTNFALNGGVITTNGGMSINNTGTLSFASGQTVTLSGSLNQTGTGVVQAAGNLVAEAVGFIGPIVLVGNYTINTSATGSNVTFNSSINGPFNMTIEAGAGIVDFATAIADTSSLNNFTIISANNIVMNGVGTPTAGVTGTLSLTASQEIFLNNTYYTAGTQIYSAGTTVDFGNGALTHLTTLGGPVSFNSGSILLSDKNDLSIVTNGGQLSYNSISGTNFENVLVNTGTGTAFMNTILGPHINNIFVNAGFIALVGAMDGVNVNFQSLGAIQNLSTPQAITSQNTATFNALNGNVGSQSSPILVNTNNQIFAGAGGAPNSLADFNGSSVDNTVHAITTNPPCVIIFNGVVIKNCGAPPPPPPPPVPPKKKIPPFPFAVPGVDSSFFTLADDYFFKPYFFDERYVRREVAMDYVGR